MRHAVQTNTSRASAVKHLARRARTVWLFLPALLVVGLAHAGTALRLDWPDLVQASDLAVHARVLRATPRLAAASTKHESRIVETEYEVIVLDDLRGNAGRQCTFVQPGGFVGDSSGGRGMMVPGLRTMKPGDELLLFLSAPSVRGWRMPIGLSQGSMPVLRDVHGKAWLSRELGCTTLLDAGTGVPTNPTPVERIDLDETMSRLRALFAVRAKVERALREGR